MYVCMSSFLFQDDSDDDTQLSSNSFHSTCKMTTRASVCISNDDEDCVCTSPNSEEINEWNPDTSGPDGKCSAGSDGIPGTSGLDGGPGTTSTRDISGGDVICLARHDGSSCPNEDNYSSYLTLVATISDDSSEDEGLKQAIIASMESHM